MSNEHETSYCATYWDYLRGDRAECPKPEDFALTDGMAGALRGQCRIEMHRKLDAQAPAVSFTKAEARQAAEDLRGIAATCCELGHVEDEKILRVLAQKFDGKEDNE